MVQNKEFYINKTLNIGGKLLDFKNAKVMGVLNVTPDSFYDGGKFITESSALAHVESMIDQGVDIIDVGGYSSRPQSDHISFEEEAKRTRQIILRIAKEFPETIISIDTFRSEIAKMAVDCGAKIVNDISGGQLDSKMFEVVANLKVPYILMHMRGTPTTMTSLTKYDILIKDITLYFQEKILSLQNLGVKDIIIDPGLGFAKTVKQNFELLRELSYFQILEKPIMVGLSRKSMIWKTLDSTPDKALNGTSALHALALSQGANILRVHDVKEAKECVKLVELYLDK